MPKYVIVGASGSVGIPTVEHLVKHLKAEDVYVATRHPESPKPQFVGAGVRLIHGDLNDVGSLTEAFKDATAAFIIPPGVENRAELAENGIRAAKAAGVRHLVVMSVTTAGKTSTVFGRQFHAIESATLASGLTYTIIRLPMFTENYVMQADAIKGTGKIYGPVNPSVKLTTVALEDAGRAAAMVIANLPSPGMHDNRTYNISSPAYTLTDLTKALTAVAGRRVHYERLSYEDAAKSYLDKGMPEWQVRGTMELMMMEDAGVYEFPSVDYKAIIGEDPMSIEQWVDENKLAFQ